MSLLEVREIVKNFGDLNVLKGISFNLEKGEVLAIIGSSGSGKTTLLRCLNFLEIASSGEISVNDEIIFDAKVAYKDSVIREKRLHFGLVFQQFNLFPQYTVLQNITLASKLQARQALRTYESLVKKDLKANKQSLSNVELKELKKNKKSEILQKKQEMLSEIEEKANKLLKKVGLEDKATCYPNTLSGGQQQRVAIARALALNPSILCFDEPTSALDPELTGEVLKVIKGLKDKECTMIVVTHEMEFAKKVADKVIFMSDGVIEEMGTPQEVFDNPQSAKTRAFLQKSNDLI